VSLKEHLAIIDAHRPARPGRAEAAPAPTWASVIEALKQTDDA
jgi:hypothetical protein